VKPSARIALALCLALSACGKDKESETKLRRSGDKAAVVVVGATETAAGLATEVEPNNELEQAQAVAIGAGVSGTLEGSLDVDTYQVVSAEEGLLFLRLEGAADADLKLALLKLDGTVLASSDRGPATTTEGVAGYWVDADAEYLVAVSEFTKKKLRKTGGRTGTSAAYSLRVSFQGAAEQDFEVEPNEDLAGAKEVGAGVEGRGYMGWTGDADWWRIPVSGFGDVQASPAEGEEASPTPALNISVSGMAKVATVMELTTAGGELVASITGARGKEVAYRSFVPAVAADFYILKLRSKRSNPDENYVIRVEATELGPGQELEPNDSLETASPIASAVGELGVASGELCLGDVDMFVLESAPVNRSLDLRLEGPTDADLSVSVVTASGSLVALGEKSGVGGSESLQAVDVPAGTSPVVIVRPKKVLMPASYKLSFSVSEGQGVPQIPLPPASENPLPVE
jgi:hypothetical protein